MKKKADSSDVLEQLERSIGEKHEDVFCFSQLSEESTNEIESVSTGFMGVDRITRVGGFPKGKVVELYGMESTGKSTLALQAIAEANRYGETGIYFDVECGINPSYLDKLGIHKDKFMIVQALYGEDTFAVIIDNLLEVPEISIIVIDSLAALVPRIELEGELTDDQYAAKARMMAKCLRRLVNGDKKGAIPLARSGKALVIINQLISNVGGYGGNTTPGGKALRFYAALRIELTLDKDVSVDSEKGHGVKFTVKKNKLGIPYRTCSQLMMYDHGFDRTYDVLNEGMEVGIIQKSGSWYKWGGQSFQGITNFRLAANKDPEMLDKLRDEIGERSEKQKIY